MKSFRKCMWLCVVILLVFVTPFMSSGYAENGTTGFSGRTETIEANSVTAFSEQHALFVHEPERNYFWLNDSVDLSSCIPGYLYARNKETNEVLLLWDQPVSGYVRLGARLLVTCTEQNTIYEITAPLTATAFYVGEGENVGHMMCTDDYLFFVDGSSLKSYDPESEVFSELCSCGDVEWLFARNYDNAVVWRTSTEECFAYYTADGTYEAVDLEDFHLGEPIMEPETNVDINGRSERSGLVSLPLSEYPVGSYFSRNGEECSDRHGCDTEHDCDYSQTCNCLMYKGTIQCMGFAEYVADQYAHSPNFNWRVSSADKNESIQSVRNADEAEEFFSDRRQGDYLRVRGAASSGHSIVIAGISPTGISIYEGNYGGNCRVYMRTMTYAEFANAYANIVCVVSHSFDGLSIKYSSAYHKVTCSTTDCDGYILIPHYAASVGSPTRCAACGYIGNFSEGLV